MSKINYKSDLPKWFRGENYDCLAELTKKELLAQIRLRAYLLSQEPPAEKNINLSSNKRTERDFYSLMYKLYWRQVEVKDVIIKMHMESFTAEKFEGSYDSIVIEEIDELEQRSQPKSAGISGFKSLDAIYHTQSLEKNGLISFMDGDIGFADEKILLNDYDLIDSNLDQSKRGSVTMKIDLKNHSNKQLIKEFSEMLLLCREQAGIPEPENILRSRANEHSKIIDYQVIPLLDLQLWEKQTKNKISHNVLIECLFPFGEIDEFGFVQIIRPFINKVSNNNYR